VCGGTSRSPGLRKSQAWRARRATETAGGVRALRTRVPSRGLVPTEFLTQFRAALQLPVPWPLGRTCGWAGCCKRAKLQPGNLIRSRSLSIRFTVKGDKLPRGHKLDLSQEFLFRGKQFTGSYTHYVFSSEGCRKNPYYFKNLPLVFITLAGMLARRQLSSRLCSYFPHTRPNPARWDPASLSCRCKGPTLRCAAPEMPGAEFLTPSPATVGRSHFWQSTEAHAVRRQKAVALF